MVSGEHAPDDTPLLSEAGSRHGAANSHWIPVLGVRPGNSIWEPHTLTGTHFLNDTFYVEVTVDPQTGHEDSEPRGLPPVPRAHQQPSLAATTPARPLPPAASKSMAPPVPFHPAGLPGRCSGRCGSRAHPCGPLASTRRRAMPLRLRSLKGIGVVRSVWFSRSAAIDAHCTGVFEVFIHSHRRATWGHWPKGLIAE